MSNVIHGPALVCVIEPLSGIGAQAGVRTSICPEAFPKRPQKNAPSEYGKPPTSISSVTSGGEALICSGGTFPTSTFTSARSTSELTGPRIAGIRACEPGNRMSRTTGCDDAGKSVLDSTCASVMNVEDVPSDLMQNAVPYFAKLPVG